MENGISFEYRSMVVKCESLGQTKEHDKVEINWSIEAYKNGDYQGGWNFGYFRVDPSHHDPMQRMYIASSDEIIQSGKNLVNAILKANPNLEK
jgi:hypothetical protein